MSRFSSSSSSIPPAIPALPRRPLWTNEGLMDFENISWPLDAVATVIGVWNQWADAVEDVFRIMNTQSDNLDVSVDDYIGWISRFSNHPARPTMSPAEEARDGSMGVAHIPLMRAHSRWEGFADELAETHSIMARELSRCKLRPGGAHEVVDCDIGILDFSKLSLSANTPTLTQVKGVFSAMLGPGRSFHRASCDSELQHMPVLSDNTWDIDEQFAGSEQSGGQSGLYAEDRPRRDWADKFLKTLGEINREMEDEEYRGLNLGGLAIEDQGMEG